MLQAQFVILPILIALCGLAVVISGVRVRQDAKKYSSSFADVVGLGFVIPTVFAALFLIIFIICLVPFNPRYYFITAHTGTVSTVSNQFVNGSGDNTSQSFIVTLEGDEIPYELTDTRASVLDMKDVTLNCTTEFVWAGADRMNCVIGEVR